MSKATASEAWTWRHAVVRSGLPPTTRHVLLTLSVFMDEMGRSCFPSIDDLIETTGLGRTSIIKHLAEAVSAGWIRKSRHGFGGRRWRHGEYEPCWPGRDIEGSSLGEPPPDDEVVHVANGGGSGGDSEAVREVNRVRDQSIHQSKTSPVGAAARPNDVTKIEEGLLLDAAGDSINRTRPNFFMMTTPERWKAAGMDWELDVLPAVRAAASRAPPSSIRKWEYFTGMIADLHAERTKPMPVGNANRRPGHGARRRTTADLARDLAAVAVEREREAERDDHGAGQIALSLPGT